MTSIMLHWALNTIFIRINIGVFLVYSGVFLGVLNIFLNTEITSCLVHNSMLLYMFMHFYLISKAFHFA